MKHLVLSQPNRADRGARATGKIGGGEPGAPNSVRDSKKRSAYEPPHFCTPAPGHERVHRYLHRMPCHLPGNDQLLPDPGWRACRPGPYFPDGHLRRHLCDQCISNAARIGDPYRDLRRMRRGLSPVRGFLRNVRRRRGDEALRRDLSSVCGELCGDGRPVGDGVGGDGPGKLGTFTRGFLGATQHKRTAAASASL